MGNKNRNRQQQKASTMPQDDQTKPVDQAAADAQASQQASDAAEETGDTTGAAEGDASEGQEVSGRLDVGFEIPEDRPADLSADSTEEQIAALASFVAWSEFTGVADLTNEQLIAQIQARRAELIETYTATVAGLKSPVVIEQGTKDNSSAAVEAAPEVTATAVATAAAATTVVSTAAKDALTVFEQLLERTEKAGTPQQKNLVKGLKSYMERMAPGAPVGNQEGARQQQTLWLLLQGVVSNTDALEFRKQWFIVLSFFNEYGGRRQVFNGVYVFRFAESWSRNPDELDAMQRLINLIHLTANPENRAQGLKQVDLDRSLAKGFNPTARQNLISFYKGN